MKTTRVLLALLVIGAAACSHDATSPEPTSRPLLDGSAIIGSGEKTDSTTTTSSTDSTSTSGG